MILQALTKMCGKLIFSTGIPVENSVETVENIAKQEDFAKMKRMFLWKSFYI